MSRLAQMNDERNAAHMLDSLKKEVGIKTPTPPGSVSNDVYHNLPHSHYGYEVHDLLLDRGMALPWSHWEKGMGLTRYELAVALIRMPYTSKGDFRLIDAPRSKAREWLYHEGWTPDEVQKLFRLIDELKPQIDQLRPIGRRNPVK
jgi:hypothetical protein